MYKIVFFLLAILLSGCGNNIKTQRVNKEILLELMYLNPNSNLCMWSCNSKLLNHQKENDTYVNLYYNCIPTTNNMLNVSVLINKYDLEISRKEYKKLGSIVMYKGIQIELPQEFEGHWMPFESHLPWESQGN